MYSPVAKGSKLDTASDDKLSSPLCSQLNFTFSLSNDVKNDVSQAPGGQNLRDRCLFLRAGASSLEHE